MNLEIFCHYCTKNPDLREVKIKLDGKVIQSSFMDLEQLLEFIVTKINPIENELWKAVEEM